MKAIWVSVVALGISVTAAAETRPLVWDELNPGQTLTLRHDVSLSDKVRLGAGTKVRVTEREALSAPGMSMIYFGAEESPCAHPAWESAMELILPEGEVDSARAVGVELAKGCRLGIYVETKDLESIGIFNP